MLDPAGLSHHPGIFLFALDCRSQSRTGSNAFLTYEHQFNELGPAEAVQNSMNALARFAIARDDP
jgi:hypothetical protein